MRLTQTFILLLAVMSLTACGMFGGKDTDEGGSEIEFVEVKKSAEAEEKSSIEFVEVKKSGGIEFVEVEKKKQGIEFVEVKKGGDIEFVEVKKK